jgi:uncharacterized protein (TIRG00374 family)
MEILEEEQLQESVPQSWVKSIVVAVVKVAASLGIVGFLLYRAAGNNAFADLTERPKNWLFLAGATLASGIAVLMTHIRWMWLVQALGLSLRCQQAVRIGSWGYLVNLAPLGIVGGDLVKVWMLVQQVGGHRAKAMASVIVDRVLGLYTVFIIGSAAILATGFADRNPTMHTLSMYVHLITILATVGIGMLFVLGSYSHRFMHRLEAIPRIGPALHQLVGAFHMYQQNAPALVLALIMTLVLQALFVVSMWLIALGLYDTAAALSAQFVVVPLASSTGAIPLPLGPFEGALDLLYAELKSPAHQGLIVALAYRIICVVIAVAGMGYYLLTKPPKQLDPK